MIIYISFHSESHENREIFFRGVVKKVKERFLMYLLTFLVMNGFARVV